MSDQAIIGVPTEPNAVAVTPIEPEAYGSFISGVALTFGTRLVMLVGMVGSSVVVARWSGPVGLGTLAVLNTTVMLALQIGSAGLPSANTYFIAKDRRSLGPVWANAVAFAFIAGAGLAMAVGGLAETMPALFGDVPARLVAIIAISIPFQLLILLGLNALLAMDRIRQLNLLDSLAPALAFANAVVVLVVLRANLTTLVVFNTAAAVVIGLAMVWAVGRLWVRQKERRACRPDMALLKKMLGYGVKFYASIIASVAIFRADLLIVNHFRGAGEAGVYAVASQVSFLLMMLPAVIGMLLFPRVATAQDPRGEFAIQVTRHVSFVMLIVCAAAAAGSFLLPVIYGPRFSEATIQLLILLPGVCLVGIESVLVQHFTGTGLPVAIPMFWLITLVLNLGLNLVLVPALGARGAAITSTVSYALIFFLVAIYFWMKSGRTPAEMFLLRAAELRDLLGKLHRVVFSK